MKRSRKYRDENREVNHKGDSQMEKGGGRERRDTENNSQTEGQGEGIQRRHRKKEYSKVPSVL